MTSRRTTARSSNGNGRSSNGEDVNGNSRSGGCTYLSNVRPENRSTLCSVIAYLTEETQPTFETTLKSKAVSENCNVKFSCVVTGYPAPQVMWYKDDMQLDRYCGLPKYEIFRSGQNHSLHIYKCTVEDAAIYQASAINSKGIVSCSGVLEVGEMNEFKIHQRYFAKLKQKAENRRREAEGKENQEPIRTISPDRTQRKRRSTMEAFLSTPSSMEDEGTEENHQAIALETKARLQEATVKEVEEKQVQVTNGAMSGLSKEQTINDNWSKGEAYISNSTQKIFTTHQPKNPFVKKKIKISNSAKAEKADALAERISVERRLKEETSASVATTVQTQVNSDEVMEVENISSSSVAHSEVTNMIKEDQKSIAEVAVLPQRPSQDEKICTEETVASQKEEFTASVPPAAFVFSSHTRSRTEGENAVKYEKNAGHNDAGETLKMQEQIPYITTKQPQSSVTSTHLSILKEDFRTTAMDVNVNSKASADGSLAHRDSESVEIPCDSSTALSHRPCEPAGHQLSETETSPGQKKVPVSQLALPSEVTQDPTKMNRNDAPVSLELPPDLSMVSSQQQKTLIERPTTTDDIQTSLLHSGFKTDIDRMTQDHSRESNEVLFTNVQKSPLESPVGSESTLGCNISLNVLQSQVDTAIKTVEGTGIQDDEKVDVTKLLVQDNSEAPNEKMVEMETETVAVHIEQTKTENIKDKSKDAGNKDAGGVIVDAPYKETGKNEPVSKVLENSSSDLQNLKTDMFDTPPSLLTKNVEIKNSVKQIKGFKEISKPETKVISIAELLRSQIKALDSTLANPASVIPSNANLHNQSTTSGACHELVKDGRKLEVKKSMSDRENKKRIDDTPPTTIKATLMEVYHQLYKTDQEQSQTQDVTSPPVQASKKPPLIPPISIIDSGTNVVITGLHVSGEKYNEGVMDIGQETQPSTLVHPKIFSAVVSQKTTLKQNFPSLTSEDKLNSTLSNIPGTVSQESGSPLTVTHTKPGIQGPNITILEHTKDEPGQGKHMEFITTEIKLNSKTERGITERNLTTISDQCKMEEHYSNTSSLRSIEKFLPESESNTQDLPLIQKEMAKEGLCSDSTASPTADPSPLLKKRNCVSPIPSATPQELASGARRKILTPKAKPEEATEATSPVDNQTQKKEVSMQSSKLSTTSVAPSISPSLSRLSPLLQPTGEQTSPLERCSPLSSRKKMASETQTTSQLPAEEIRTEGKAVEKDKHNPFKAPQVIRKIRAETFADASGHLKLWCQFFNVLSNSTIRWYKNEVEIAQVKRNAGDEAQVNLTILQASSKDSGVYGCSITNEYGTDSTDILLSADILTGLSLREDLGVGEEIEMTPLIFNKGVADSGVWGNKFFGRIMMKESHIGAGCSHKVWRAKVIYGLEPVFESGNTCIIKVRNPIAYGGKQESCLIDRNLDIVKQECKIQNLAREYCKIFSAETRVIENFGPSLEVIPVYLMYRPANAVPYATVEMDLTGEYQKFSDLGYTGRVEMRGGSEVEQKCCALQHWIFQWTNGNLLFTRLEGVDTKITNVGISVKSTGHQGLSIEANPKVFEQFVSQHKCNYFCGLLGLRSLKVMDSLLIPTKPKGSRSPLLQRKMAAGSSSPQTGRKAAGSPRLSRKTEQEGMKTPTKQKADDAPKVIKI